MTVCRNFLFKLKEGTEFLNYGRDIILEWAKACLGNKDSTNVLDLGLGTGSDLLNIKNNHDEDTKINFYGVESYLPNVKKAQEKGIDVAFFDIERVVYPYNDDMFDLIIANQIFEHVKEIFWILSEVSRIIKPEAHIIIGVPNLASLHNRIALLFGEQPTSIEVLGPHVRGYTKRSFINFIETDGYFKVLDVKGSNFYPFQSGISKKLAIIFPNLAVSSFYLIKRTKKNGVFRDVLKKRFLETPYYIGHIPNT